MNLQKSHLITTLASLLLACSASADQFLVEGSGGPGFTSPQQELTVLENGILPMFEALAQLEKNKTITAGGLPVGARSMTFILEADSNAEVDRILRGLPAWGVLQWKVTPLQSFSSRADTERKVASSLKKAIK